MLGVVFLGKVLAAPPDVLRTTTAWVSLNPKAWLKDREDGILCTTPYDLQMEQSKFEQSVRFLNSRPD